MKHTMMNKMLFSSLLAVGLASAANAATVIWSDDFTSTPVVNNTVDNGNTNLAGTGAANDMNQDEWYTRGTRSTITHDIVNGNLDIDSNNNNVYFLMDLTDLENDPGAASEFQISFNVVSLTGSIDFFAFAGGGLDYSGTGTGDGRIVFRTYGNPPSFSPTQGATETQIVDGTTTTIASTGTFTTSSFTLTDLDQSGDYVVIGFASNSNDITIDNLQLSAFAVPEPSTAALLGLGGLALILRRRK